MTPETVEPRGEIIRAGLCTQSKSTQLDQPATTAGYSSYGRLQIVSDTTVVPMRRHIAFGFSWRAVGLPRDARVDFTIRHPIATRPDGQTFEGFSETLNVSADQGMVQSTACYALSQEHELVPGRWSMAIAYQGRVLVERAFTVEPER